MPWLRLGDDSDNHPIVMRVFGFGPVRKLLQLDPWERTNLVHGFVLRCATNSAGHLTDRIVSKGTAMHLGGPSWERWARDAAKAGYWRRTKVDGQDCFEIVDDPEFIHIRLKAAVEFDRMRDTDRKNPSLTMPVRLRDGDACRYCGLTVNWADRKGARGGTYDHTQPDRPTTVDTYVVACRGCNSGREKNPDGYTLRQPPPEPYYHPKTLEQLVDAGLLTRPASQADTATTRPASQADTALTRPASQADTALTRPGTQPDTAPEDSNTPRDRADSPTPRSRDPAASRTTRPDERDPAAGRTTRTDLSDPTDPEAGGSGLPGSGRDRDRSGGGSGAPPPDRGRGKRGRRRSGSAR